MESFCQGSIDPGAAAPEEDLSGIVVPGSGALLLTALGLGVAYAVTPG